MSITYADVTVSMSYHLGTVRIDLGVLVQNDEHETATTEKQHTLVMPVSGFLSLLESGEDLVKKMEENGIIKQAAKKEDGGEE